MQSRNKYRETQQERNKPKRLINKRQRRKGKDGETRDKKMKQCSTNKQEKVAKKLNKIYKRRLEETTLRSMKNT